MKTKNLLFVVIIAVLFTSCVTTYYQVYKITPIDKTLLKENSLVYEDENCIVYYNFWDEGGNVGFKFYNKTNQNIYLNMEESFFILNGVAYNYYQNRIFSNSSNYSTAVSRSTAASKSMTGVNNLDLIQTNRISLTNSVGFMTSSGYSVSYVEEKIICIPSLSSKIIRDYAINKSLFRDCDLFKYPSKKQIKPKSFTKSNSPLVFKNSLVYSIGQSGSTLKFGNEFYVSEITNYPENEIIEKKNEEYCGQKGSIKIKFFKNVSPDKFFVKYSKGQDTWKH